MRSLFISHACLKNITERRPDTTQKNIQAPPRKEISSSAFVFPSLPRHPERSEGPDVSLRSTRKRKMLNMPIRTIYNPRRFLKRKRRGFLRLFIFKIFQKKFNIFFNLVKPLQRKIIASFFFSPIPAKAISLNQFFLNAAIIQLIPPKYAAGLPVNAFTLVTLSTFLHCRLCLRYSLPL